MNPEAGAFLKEQKDYVYLIENESQQGASLIKYSYFLWFILQSMAIPGVVLMPPSETPTLEVLFERVANAICFELRRVDFCSTWA